MDTIQTMVLQNSFADGQEEARILDYNFMPTIYLTKMQSNTNLTKYDIWRDD